MYRPSPKRIPPQRALLVVLTALVAAVLPAAAGAEDGRESPLRAGAWAAEFEIDPTYRYDLGFSSGATISLKRHKSARSAVRFGVSVGFDETQGEGGISEEGFSTYPSPTLEMFERKMESHYEQHSYALLVHLQRYHPVRESVSLFWEVGPSFRYSESQSSDDLIYPPDPSDGSTTIDRAERVYLSRSVSVDLSLGFEWFFTHGLSLGARTGAWGGYGWGVDNTTNRRSKSDGSLYYLGERLKNIEKVSIQSSDVTVLFSAYF